MGNDIVITASSNHMSVNKNPGPYGKANTSVDILGSYENIKEHTEASDEHTWEYKNGKLKRN